MSKKKLLIFVISYKASFRLIDVYNKIPFKKLSKYETSLLLSDDASGDDTVNYEKKIKDKHKKKNILIKENKKNLGYGGNIKKCLNFSLKKKFDYAVMIHGDGQYDPKHIPSLVKEISRDNTIGACTGSRLLGGTKGATKGGMPYYKLLGNILLTSIFKPWPGQVTIDFSKWPKDKSKPKSRIATLKAESVAKMISTDSNKPIFNTRPETLLCGEEDFEPIFLARKQFSS